MPVSSSLYSLEDTKGWDVYVPAKSNRHILNVSENLTGRNKRDDYKEYSCELKKKKKNAQSNILLSLLLGPSTRVEDGGLYRQTVRS